MSYRLLNHSSPISRKFHQISGQLVLALALTLLASCYEVSPEVVHSGDSRPFAFDKYYVTPLHAAVIITGGQLDGFSPNIPGTDTTGANAITNCTSRATLSRQIADWPWIDNKPKKSFSAPNNYAIYLAEKAYSRFFTAYCVGYTSFYNERTAEGKTVSSTLIPINYLQSTNLNITHSSGSAVYNYLVSQTEAKDGVSELLHTLAQHGGSPQNRLYERLNYTKDTKTNETKFAYISLLIDKDYTDDNSLPKFYHMQAYSMHRQMKSGSSEIYDLIRTRTARLIHDPSNDNFIQTVINAKLITNKTYGTYVTEAAGCAISSVLAVNDLLPGDCPSLSTRLPSPPVYYADDAAKIRLLSGVGLERKNATAAEKLAFDNAKKALGDFSNDVDTMNLHWFNFKSDKLTDMFQTTKPEDITFDIYAP